MIRYLPHAEAAMEKRGVSREAVEATLTTPDWTEPDPTHRDRVRSFKLIDSLGGRVLRVVHWTEGTDLVVLTVMPDRDAQRRRSRT